MGSTNIKAERPFRSSILRRALACALAVLLMLGLMPAQALAAATPRSLDDGSPQQTREAPADDPYGTDVSASGAVADMAEGAAVATTDVSVAVLNDFDMEVTLDQPYFDYTHQPAAPNDAIRVVVKGGSKRAEGEPYTWTWTRDRRGVGDRDFTPDPDPAGSWMAGQHSVTCQTTSEGAVLSYPLWKDRFRERMTYRYTVTVCDAAGQELTGEVFVYYGWPYAPGWAKNSDTRDLKTEISARAMLLGSDDGTRSQLVVEDVAREVLPELYPLAEGYVIDSVSNVSCTNALTDEEHPAYITPPSISLSIRMRDADAVEVGTPVKVLSIQNGRPVVVAEGQVVIDDITVDGEQSPNFGHKIARVGNFAQNIWYQTGVDELGVFAVAYLPADAADRQMRVTSQAMLAEGADAAAGGSPTGGAVVPADSGRVYLAGAQVRYTFLPEYGYEVQRVMVGTDPTGREGTCVFDPSRNIFGDGAGANFYDLVVPAPADVGGETHLYVTVFYEESAPPDPTDPDDPYKPVDPTDPDPYEPLDPNDPDGPKRGFIVRAEVAAGVGQVSVEGAAEVDPAGQWAFARVAPTGSAAVSFLPGEVDGQTYVLERVTMQTKDLPEMELSVLNLRYVLASVTSDTTIRAYFQEGAYLPRTQLDITYAQVDADTGEPLAEEVSGWAFVDPAAIVFYGNPLSVALSATDAQKAEEWELQSLTFNGEEVLQPGGAARGAGFASYMKDYITQATHVQAAFKKKADTSDPGDDKDPDNPNKPGDGDGDNKPGGDNGNKPGGDGDGSGNGSGNGSGSADGNQLCTVTASSEGHGTIAPAGTMRVPAGTQIVFTLTPDAAYRPAMLTITDAQGIRKVRTSATTYTLKVTGDTEVRAAFAAQVVLDNSLTGRTIRRLQSLAQTGDLNLPIALALIATASAAAGIILLTKRRRRQEER